MAKLPIYNSQGNITSEAPKAIMPVQQDNSMAEALINTGNALGELAEQWQNSKDQVETLDAKNKLFEQSSNVLQQAEQFTGYTDQKQIDEARIQFQQQLSQVTPNLLQGFSSQRAAKNFQLTSQMANRENQIKLDAIMRNKTIDLGTSNLLKSADLNMKAFTKSGNVAYKNNYFADIDGAFKAGIIDAEKVTALKQSTDDWNYNFVYSQLLTNPYYKASKEIMDSIDPVKQRTLQNFARTEQKRAEAEKLQTALGEFYTNPSKRNLKRVHKAHSGSKNNKNLDYVVNTPPNFKAISTLDGYADAVGAIKELAGMPTGSYNQKMEYIKKSSDTALRIIKSNISSGTSTLSKSDKDKLINMIYGKMNDATFKSALRDMPDLSKLKATEIAGKGNSIQARQNYDKFNSIRFGKTFSVPVKINDIGKRTAEEVIAKYIAGDYKGGQAAYQRGLHEAIRIKYWYIPELQNPNLQVGQHFSVNGKVYKFNGYTQKDIIVEGN